MKKSYKKLFLFELVFFTILFLNSFISNILSGYSFVILLFLSLVAFKFIFGFERDRNRFTKDIIFEIIVFLVIFFIVYYLLGIVIGLAKTANYYTWYGMKTFIIPLILQILLKEFLRYNMLKKSEGNKLLLVLTVLMFIFVDITNSIYYNDFKNAYDTFILVAMYILPTISKNIFCSYLSLNVGYKPSIIYLLIFELYVYLLPIIPNPNQYLTSVVTFLLPILLFYRSSVVLKRQKDEHIDRDYNKKSAIGLLVPALIVVLMVYFTSGYFRFYAVAIASGSMENKIHKGDIVVIDKEYGDMKNIKVGQVLAYKHQEIVVIHRIINIVEYKGEYFFYTQGDANPNPDNWTVTKDMILGIVKARIPYAGMPTIWLNEL